MTERAPTTKQIVKWLGILALAYMALFASVWTYLQHSSSPFREEEKREAESVVQRFHEGYNARQIDRICDDLFACRDSTDLQGAWNSYLNRVRESAGPFRSLKTSNIRISIEPFDVRATFVSSFEKGVATESFVLMDRPPKGGSSDYGRPGPLKIMSYQVRINGEWIAAR